MVPLDTMPTPKKKPAPKPRRPAKAVGTPSLAEIGKLAAEAAQRQAVLNALRASNWSPSAAAEALRVPGGAASMLRSIRRLGLQEEYDRARSRLGLKPGPQPTARSNH